MASTSDAGEKPATYGTYSNKRQKQKEQTREKLLSAATSWFIKKGFEATTVDDIATGAGVSRQAFYLHFQTKQDIIETIRDNVEIRITEEYRTLANISGVTVRRLADWINHFLDVCREDQQSILILLRIIPGMPGFLRRHTDYYIRMIALLSEKIPAFRTAVAGDKQRQAEALLLLFQLEMLIRVHLTTNELDQDAMSLALARQIHRFMYETPDFG